MAFKVHYLGPHLAPFALYIHTVTPYNPHMIVLIAKVYITQDNQWSRRGTNDYAP
jgi:hypothetical protein